MRRPMTGVVALAAVLVISACNIEVTGRGAQSGVPTGGPPVPTTEASATGSAPDPTDEVEPAVFRLGDTGTVTDAEGEPLADVTVTAAELTLVPPDEFSDPPVNGGFLAATVTIVNLGESAFAVAPLDFEVRYPTGTRIAYGTGSTGVFGFDDPLGVLQLAAGESVTGIVAFDVDPDVTGQRIAYLDLAGRVLGAWLIP